MNTILLGLIVVINLSVLIVSILSRNKYKNNCEDDNQIVTYNNVILFGALLIIILIAILFFTNKNTVSKFSFGWGSSKSM
jgi:uncharacterized membrane protein